MSEAPTVPPKVPLARDPDLVCADTHLSNTKLDQLWAWFNAATQQDTDPQFIFATLVNSVLLKLQFCPLQIVSLPCYANYIPTLIFQVRKCYLGEPGAAHARDRPLEKSKECKVTCNTKAQKKVPGESVLEDLRNSVEQVHKQVTTNTVALFRLWQYASGEDNLPEDVNIIGLECNQNPLDPPTGPIIKESMFSMVRKAKEVQANFQSLKTKYENKARSSPAPEPILARDCEPTFVAIKSAFFADRYMQMISHKGIAQVSTSIGGWEIFELMRCGPGIVSFKSTWSTWSKTDAYLSANGPSKTQQDKMWQGWNINCKPSCGPKEQFRILSTENQGVVNIELADYPGRYLSIDGDNLTAGVNSSRGGSERFYLLVLR
ncbi:hypothetical protein BDZ91DRAFT_797931 [Kalaharituber pfeilii]|nr:hypothetical protein BDZ91DRAFT_797931 [Kalaharituber pfeilii]